MATKFMDEAKGFFGQTKQQGERFAKKAKDQLQDGMKRGALNHGQEAAKNYLNQAKGQAQDPQKQGQNAASQGVDQAKNTAQNAEGKAQSAKRQ